MYDIKKIKSLFGTTDRITDNFGISETKFKARSLAVAGIILSEMQDLPDGAGEVGLASVIIEKILGIETYTPEQLLGMVLALKFSEHAAIVEHGDKEPFSMFHNMDENR